MLKDNAFYQDIIYHFAQNISPDFFPLLSLISHSLLPPKPSLGYHRLNGINFQDPRQIFYGLEPGWLVSIQDKTIFKPVQPELNQVYKS